MGGQRQCSGTTEVEALRKLKGGSEKGREKKRLLRRSTFCVRRTDIHETPQRKRRYEGVLKSYELFTEAIRLCDKMRLPPLLKLILVWTLDIIQREKKELT